MATRGHFWYSLEAEKATYERLAVGLEFGVVTQWNIPHYNYCKIEVAGEPLEIRYNFMADQRNTYEKGMDCEVGWSDIQYLGEGEISKIGPSLTLAEVHARMVELDMLIPHVISKGAAK